MHRILLGLVSALLVTTMTAVADDSDQRVNRSDEVTISDTNNPAQAALEKVMRDDDAAMDDIDRWIQDNNAYAAHGAGESKKELNAKIMARVGTVRTEYEDFFKQYPTNAPGYLAFGSFLNEIGDEDGASVQYEKSRALDPSNPAVWNDLANYYGENGPITNAFAYYQKAVDLNSNEPVYYENWATTVYLFRKDAKEFYGINESQVFDKSLALYQKAVALDPDNFVLMTDYAESYYGIKPLRINDALVAWTNALKIAHNDTEREGVYIHLARVKMLGGDYAEAQAHLNDVTNTTYDALKYRLQRALLEHENKVTNSVETNGDMVMTNSVSDLTNSPPVSPSDLPKKQ